MFYKDLIGFPVHLKILDKMENINFWRQIFQKTNSVLLKKMPGEISDDEPNLDPRKKLKYKFSNFIQTNFKFINQIILTI